MFPPGVGGSEVYAHELANALGALGHRVDVYTQSEQGTGAPPDLHDNVTVTETVPARNYLVTFETLYYSVKTRLSVDFDAYDIVHGTLMPASTIGLGAIDPPVVVTSHSFAPSEVRAHSPDRPADVLLKFFFHPMNAVMDLVAGRNADHVIAISSQMQTQLSDTYRIPTESITLINHGVNTARFYPRDDDHERAATDRFTVLFVGRLITRKGAATAIRSLAETHHENVELLIAGSGRQRSSLEELVAELGIHQQVEFLGYVPEEELPRLYSASDVLVFPPAYEGFGLVFLEAMACGTPVIGTRVGGVPDLIEDGETGFVVEGGSVEIAERIDQLADDPELLARMSTAAAENAGSRDWQLVAERVEDLYQTLLDEK